MSLPLRPCRAGGAGCPRGPSSPLDDDDDEEEEEEAADKGEDEDDDMDEEDLEQATAEHQSVLRNLAQTDPEFFKHLKQYDSSLLSFEDEGDDKKGGAEEAPEDEEAEAEGSKDVITTAVFRKIIRDAVKEPSIRKVKKVTKIFAEACQFGGFKDDDKKEQSKVIINDAKTFNEIISITMAQTSKLFKPVLAAAEQKYAEKEAERRKRNRKKNGGEEQEQTNKGKASEGGPEYACIAETSKWKKWGPIARVFCKSYCMFMGKLIDRTMIRYALSHAAKLRPLFLGLKSRLSEQHLRVMLRLWANSPHDDVSIDAFVEIRGLIVAIGDKKLDVLEFGLKQAYLTFCKTARFTTARNLARIKLLADCVAKLYALDPGTGYRYAFVYIRQLAIHLRNAIVSRKQPQAQDKKPKKKKGKGASDAKPQGPHTNVYNWQFVNGLRVWARLLVSEATEKDSEFRPLVYPFIQVSLGVLTLHPTPRYWPLRIEVARFVHEVASNSSTYVPLAGHLLSILAAPELSRRVSPSSSKAPEWNGLLHANAAMVNTRQFQQEAVRRALDLLAEHLGTYAYSAAFPELIAPTTNVLRKASRDSKSPPTLRRQASALVSILRDSSAYIVQKRNGAGLSPVVMLEKGLSPVTTFKSEGKGVKRSPLEDYVATLRRTRAAKEAEKEGDAKKKSASKQKSGQKRKKQLGEVNGNSKPKKSKSPKKKRASISDQDPGENDEDGTFEDEDDVVETMNLEDLED